jgi:hypothetical protein
MISEELIDDNSLDAAFWMAGVYSPKYPIRQLGRLSMEVSEKLRTVAILRLLNDGRVNGFYHNLIRSGMVRRRYLERSKQEGLLEDHFRSSGRYLSLFDVFAAEERSLAEAIIDLSPTEFMPGHEYEDDYCYSQIVSGLVVDRNDRQAALVERYERYLEGTVNGRFKVVQALIQKDSDKFSEAFSNLLEERQAEINRNIERGQIESPPIIASRRVFIEGLGLLRLATWLGLQTEEEYLFCPALARSPMTEPFPGE